MSGIPMVLQEERGIACQMLISAALTLISAFLCLLLFYEPVRNLVNLVWYGYSYFSTLKDRGKIFTLLVPGTKIHLPTKPDAVSAVARARKAITFRPLVRLLLPNFAGLDEKHDKELCRLIRDPNPQEDGVPDFSQEVHDFAAMALAPSSALDVMNINMLHQAAKHFDVVRRQLLGESVKLYQWTKDLVAHRSCAAFYGEDYSPFNDPAVRTAFWDFEDGVSLCFLPCGRLLAPRAWRGRAIVARAFGEYYARGHYRHGSTFVTLRHASYEARPGACALSYGKLEVAIVFAIIINTTNTLFYLLMHVLSDPELLEAIRGEVTTCIKTSDSPTSPGAPRNKLLNIDQLIRLPLLRSAYHEVLRLYTRGAHPRQVSQPTTLLGVHNLRPGDIVLIPAALLHRDSATWGSDAHQFRANRFLSQPGMYHAPKGIPASAYRPFGGGNTVCPGRHFVTAEVFGILAMLVTDFDVFPSKGKWSVPEQREHNFVDSVFPPTRDVPVRFERRETGDSETWSWQFETRERSLAPPQVKRRSSSIP